MPLTAQQIAQMIDLSAVRAEDGPATIHTLVTTAQVRGCGLVTTLPAFTSLARSLLGEGSAVRLGGNVGFPSGGQTAHIKIAETRELVALGCDELDVVLNLGKLIAGEVDYVRQELQAVVTEAAPRPVKVILECHYLSPDQIRTACDLSIAAGAAFVKTGTGWAPSGATLENISFIKNHVGNAIAIKASGGIRSLETLLEMYRLGARRFGIGLRSAVHILDEAVDAPATP